MPASLSLGCFTIEMADGGTELSKRLEHFISGCKELGDFSLQILAAVIINGDAASEWLNDVDDSGAGCAEQFFKSLDRCTGMP